MIGVALDSNEYLLCLRLILAHVEPADLQHWSDLIHQAWKSEKHVFLCGNGGSGASASHMAEDLGKGLYCEPDLFDESKKRLKVISLTDNTSWITAAGNDLSYDEIFVQQLMNYGEADDLLIAISSSGNSMNVLRAVDWANRHKLVTLGLTGLDGGKLRMIAQHVLSAPIDDMGMIESVHLCLFHWVVDDLYARINGIGRYAGKSNGQPTLNGRPRAKKRAGAAKIRAR